jgi:hypothetical protein
VIPNDKLGFNQLIKIICKQILVTKIKILIEIFLLFVIFLNPDFAQEASSVKVNDSSFELSLTNRNFSYNDEKSGPFTKRDYHEFTDESSTGKFKLPSRDVIVAIPPNSKPNVSIISSEEKKYYNIVPSLNPSLEMINDSTIEIKELEYTNRVINVKPSQVIEIKGYLWLRDFYCIHIKIHTHQFDEQKSVLTELSEIKLKFEFDNQKNILSNSPLVIRSQFDENLKLILADVLLKTRNR